jgi:hypothetical protein
VPPVPKPPDRSLGVVDPGLASVAPWSQIIRVSKEHVPDLQFPQRATVYDRMLDSESQVAGLYYGTVLPLTEYTWWLDRNGADEARAQILAEDLGLPLAEREPPRDAPEPFREEGRFDFIEHLMEALRGPAHGIAYFEQQGEVVNGVWRLRRLMPLPQPTLAEIRTDSHGGLEFVRQNVGLPVQRAGMLFASQPEPIPVSQLLAYVWMGTGQERWTGRPLLRSLYRPWILKDLLARLDLVNHQRAGGIPHAEADERYEGQNLQDIQALAADMQLSDGGGGATPPGVVMKMLRGAATDIVGSMRYWDEQMASVWQQMVRMLGNTAHGSRALGETMDDHETMARRAFASWFLRIFNRHMVGDLWTWNYGPETFIPVVRCAPPAIEGGGQSAEPVAESPPVPPSVAAARPGSPRGSGVARTRRTDVASAGGEPGSRLHREAGALREDVAGPVAPLRAALPDRPLRRQPFPHEIAAATDFAAIDTAYEDAAERLDRLFREEWLPGQLATIRAIIEGTDGTAAALAQVQAPVTGLDDIAEELSALMETAADDALDELRAQGLDIDDVDRGPMRARVRDHAGAVAQQVADGLSLAASRKAVQLAGSASVADIADQVVGYLDGLKHAWETDQLRGAVQMAQNAARTDVFAAVDVQTAIYASELLDAATCDACAGVDGREYESMEEALRDYPSGGYVDCAGGPRCRGTLVLVLDES